ncbi:MAG: DUF255 domain-containing protein [Spirochaetes bacterium]|nr:DUF255 domain-containing protein [Spirochaetota bacterium]
MNHLADEKSPFLLQHASNPVGWPLTIVMTPDGNPFFAATYIPKENAYRRSGMLELVPRIAELWKNRRADILSSADSIAEELDKAAGAGAAASGGGSASAAAPEAAMVGQASAGLARMFDAKNGGFGAAPKFPMPTVFTLLLRSWKRNGGVYDQALLAFAYTETWQATSGDFSRQHQVEDDQRVAASAMSLSSSIMRTVSGPFIVIPVQNIRTNARSGETPSFSLSAAPRLTAGSDYTLM